MIATVSKTFTFESAHRLSLHAGDCKNLHGHGYKATVAVAGEVNEATGMVVDFGGYEFTIVEAFIATLDHSAIFWEEDPLYHLLRDGEFGWMKFTSMQGQPTAENIGHLIRYIAQDAFSPLGMPVVRVAIEETGKCGTEVW